jgi:hypothetical protein
MMAAGVGWAMWSVLGPGYASAGVAMMALILLMILLNVVQTSSGFRYDGEDVLARIERDDPSWKTMVPPNIVAMIESEGLFRENLPTSHIVGADDSPSQDAVRPDRPVPWLTP